ncbi:RNA polymerase sigma factor SigJ [Streptomyces sp. NPDC015492]|uniref:RNA polymerase sigma factor SigJ n=1 Tax=unclassified Streptomyces TaxID=2593676 RepID=UPI0033E1A906
MTCVSPIMAGAGTNEGDTITRSSGRTEPAGGLPPATARPEGEYRQLIHVAYRLLGSLAEAEDAVQEAFVRWYALPDRQRAAVEVPGAWLTTVVGRICLDVLGSARARRERYVGAWIPEPLPDTLGRPAGRSGDAGTDPAERIALDESLDMAFLVVLEAMTPAERVAFVLHDVFRYPFTELATIIGRTPAACRQLASSARRRVRAARTPEPPTGLQARVVKDFKQAWEAQDIAALVGLLTPDATVVVDGGGLVGAALRPITGAGEIARYLVAIGDMAPGTTLRLQSVNGRPGLVARRGGTVVTVAAFGLADGRITRIWAVRNPEKLQAWTE